MDQTQNQQEFQQQSQQQQQQVVYVTQSEQQNKTKPKDQPMTVGSWLLTLILLCIPAVGFVCCVCWFFGAGNRSRTAFIRAFVVVALLLGILVFIFKAQILGLFAGLLA